MRPHARLSFPYRALQFNLPYFINLNGFTPETSAEKKSIISLFNLTALILFPLSRIWLPSDVCVTRQIFGRSLHAVGRTSSRIHQGEERTKPQLLSPE